MKIIIVGAGQVGKSVMENLLSDHSISMIDQSSDNLDGIPYSVDVIAGDGLERDHLEEAGLTETELVITTTSDDQTNLLICNMVKVLTESYTIARVADPSFTETWETAQGAFGVDALIGRADLTAKQINDLVGLQTSAQEALNEQTFCQGHVKMSQFELIEESPLIGEVIRTLNDYGNVTFGSVYRDGEFILVQGDTSFQTGDRITVFGPPEAVDQFGVEIALNEQDPVRNTVDILGGGNLGFRTACMLEETSLSVRVFEKDSERAQFLSQHLSDSLVLEADVTQRIIWEEENLTESEMTIICTGNDQRNALTALLGQDFDAPRLVSIVHEEQYLPLFESLGIKQIVHPREVVASSIIDYVTESYARNVTMLEHESGEVFEYQITGKSPVSGKTIAELDEYLNQEFVVGAIVRQNTTIAPKGQESINTGDRLIFITTSDQAEAIAQEL